MEQTIADFVNWLTVGGYSPATVAAYRWEVEHLAEAHPGRQAVAYKAADLGAFLAGRRAEVGEAATRRSVGAYRTFFGWVLGRKSPARGLKFPKVHKRQQRTLSEAELRAVGAACNVTTDRGVRDLALVALMTDTLLRAAEVCRLELSKLDLEAGIVRVRVKGGDEGAGAFFAETADYLRMWLGVRQRYAPPDVATVFVAIGGGRPGRPLSTSGLRVIFRALGRRAGLAAFSPHDLRRTGACEYTRGGAPGSLLQIGGRWSSEREMEPYFRALRARELRPYSPVSRLLAPAVQLPLPLPEP